MLQRLESIGFFLIRCTVILRCSQLWHKPQLRRVLRLFPNSINIALDLMVNWLASWWARFGCDPRTS